MHSHLVALAHHAGRDLRKCSTCHLPAVVVVAVRNDNWPNPSGRYAVGRCDGCAAASLRLWLKTWRWGGDNVSLRTLADVQEVERAAEWGRMLADLDGI